MNQILYPQKEMELLSFPPNKKKKTFTLYQIQFYISLLIAIVFLIFYLIYSASLSQSEKKSSQLKNSYTLSTLYANDTSYQSQILTTSPSITTNIPFVMGMIKIDSLKISYPILSQISDDLLKISPCRFAGPLANEMGNLCIAGHNYVDNKFFSKLNQLRISDTISISDLSNRELFYSVISSEEVKTDDLSCTEQNTNGQRMITLITCNNVKGTRYVVKALEVKKDTNQ